jgi:hypothetical protein
MVYMSLNVVALITCPSYLLKDPYQFDYKTYLI